MEAAAAEVLDYIESKHEPTFCLYIGEGEYVVYSYLVRRR